MEYIFNADDFGRTETVNTAIAEGFKKGYLDRTTIMVNMPFFEDAVKLSEEYGFKEKVGLHINLTSGIPLTEDVKKCPRICDCETGYFSSQIFRNRKMQFFMSKTEKRAVTKEIDAQIEKYLKYSFTLLHADSHGHVHTFPAVLDVVLKELRKYDFQSVRIAANLCGGYGKRLYKCVLNNKINALNRTKSMYFDSFKSVKDNIAKISNQKGECEVMLHPNIFDGDMQIGQGLHYTDVEHFNNMMWEK